MEKAIEIKRRAQRCILNGDLDGALSEYEKLVALRGLRSLPLRPARGPALQEGRPSGRGARATSRRSTATRRRGSQERDRRVQEDVAAVACARERARSARRAARARRPRHRIEPLLHAARRAGLRGQDDSSAIDSLRRAFQVCPDNVQGARAARRRCRSAPPRARRRRRPARGGEPVRASAASSLRRAESLPRARADQLANPARLVAAPARDRPPRRRRSSAAAERVAARRRLRAPAGRARGRGQRSLRRPPPIAAPALRRTPTIPTPPASAPSVPRSDRARRRARRPDGGIARYVGSSERPSRSRRPLARRIAGDSAGPPPAAPALRCAAPAAMPQEEALPRDGDGRRAALPEVSGLLNEAQALFGRGEREAASNALVRAAQAYDRRAARQRGRDLPQPEPGRPRRRFRS